MSDRSHDDALDDELRRFLAWQAEDITDAPTAREVAMGISSRVGTRTVLPGLAPRLAWVVLAGLLALVGAAAWVGGIRPSPPLPVTYEAVFLRLEVVDEAPVVIAVGINSAGQEREIARLPGAWVAYDMGSPSTQRVYLAPMGAVSPTGLLAIPSGGADLMMRWEIFDLHQPEAEPVVVPGVSQFVESLRDTPYFRVNRRGGAFWGPDERLAIAWYHCDASCVPDLRLDFVEGRTGATTSVDVPADLAVLPYWASDGSGVYVRSDATDEPRRLLGRSGIVVDETAAVPEASCRTRDGSGRELKVETGSIEWSLPDGRRDVLTPVSGAGFACLAPDDSAIVFNREGPASAARPLAGMIVVEGAMPFDIEGSFAGWLEVQP